MSHKQLVMMIIVYRSVAFVSFFGVFGKQGECSLARPTRCKVIVRKTVKNL